MSKKEVQKHIRSSLGKISEESYEKEKEYFHQLDSAFEDWESSVGKLMKPLNSALMVLRKEIGSEKNIKIIVSRTNPKVHAGEKEISITDYLMEGSQYEVSIWTNSESLRYQHDIITQVFKTPKEVMEIIIKEVGKQLGKTKFWNEKRSLG